MPSPPWKTQGGEATTKPLCAAWNCSCRGRSRRTFSVNRPIFGRAAVHFIKTLRTPNMRKEFVPFSPPCISEEEIAEVVDTLRSDWITTGPKVKRFEQEFAAAVDAPAALALSSCTAALHLALVSLGIGPGDGVLTTPMTFCSGVNVIEQVGARPVLVDVEPDTLNIDPAKLKFLLSNLKKRRNYGGRV